MLNQTYIHESIVKYKFEGQFQNFNRLQAAKKHRILVHKVRRSHFNIIISLHEINMICIRCECRYSYKEHKIDADLFSTFR